MVVTLKDIADRTHVSVSTVSRVLNGYAYVDDKTRELIQQVALEMNYPLDRLRGPNTHRSEEVRTVLILEHSTMHNNDLSSGGTPYVINQGINSVLESKSWLPFRYSMPLLVGEAKVSRLPNIDHVGLLVIGSGVSPDILNELSNRGKPFVIIGGPILSLQLNSAMPDIPRAIYEVMEHLVARGHKRVGFVGGPNTASSIVEKYHAYRLGLNLHNLPYSEEQVVFGPFLSRTGYESTLTLLQRMPDLDAILYATDQLAVAGIQALKELNKCIPEEVAIVGFNNHENDRFSDPPLTTVDSNMRQVGEMAAHRLCMMLDNPDDKRTWLMMAPCRLIVREST